VSYRDIATEVLSKVSLMELTIRPGRSNDIDAIVQIFRACWQESYQNLLSEEVRNAMTDEKARELWLPSLSGRADRETLIAETGSNAIGVARIGSDPDFPTRGHLFSLYIHPKSAGKGFGKALFRAALEGLKERHFSEISLWVFKENLSARSLYQKMEFLPTGRERTDARWKSPEIEMLHSQVSSQL
jgi:ribosomal protein S18 acetylase RimI-like enzyme